MKKDSKRPVDLCVIFLEHSFVGFNYARSERVSSSTAGQYKPMDIWLKNPFLRLIVLVMGRKGVYHTQGLS